jgi:hypothetical protein
MTDTALLGPIAGGSALLGFIGDTFIECSASVWILFFLFICKYFSNKYMLFV